MVKSKVQLAIELSKLKTFDKPKSELEQYSTDSEIAASMLWKCYMDDNLISVADLGSGTGILGLGAALLGAEQVYLVETDKDAIAICKKNQAKLEEKFGKLPIKYVNKDVHLFVNKVNTVVMNPPFGVQNEHADRAFLEQAMKISKNIYSLHKIESKRFINKFSEENKFKLQDILKFEFPLKASMKYHKQKVRKVKVGCFILRRL